MISRRKFIQGSSATLTLAGTGISLGFAPKALAAGATKNCMVLLFFRGGMDALNLLVPRNGVNRSEYESKRPNIQIPTDRLLNLNGPFGVPDTCTGLKSLYDTGDLAFVHSVGMPDGLSSRSHFDSMTMFEMGTPGNTAVESGWLARHLHSNPALPGSAVIASMAPGTNPESLIGDTNLMSIDSADTENFHPNGGRYSEEHMSALRQIHGGDTPLARAMQGTLNNVDILTELSLEIPGYYPNETLAQDLALIAQVIKADLGLHIATVDFGGWDTHQGMGDLGNGYFVDRLGEVSAAIAAFFQDLGNAGLKDRVVLATQTEFGRRVRENGNKGTDHGSGQVMMLAGGNINGGQVFGRFPGIRNDELYYNADLRPTTDFRQPLGELIRGHLGNPNVSTVFPGWTEAISMGLVQRSIGGVGDLLFETGFEA